MLARNAPRHPIHPVAYLRQSKGKWYGTHNAINASLRRFTSSARSGLKYDRSSFPKSTIGTAVNRLSSRAPFATTLRPNLTGGALPRTAGGYSVGAGRSGGARYFSHTPAAPAEVVSNVSAAVRAFWLSGQKAQFDGVDPRSGANRYRAVSALREETCRKLQSMPKMAPGSFIDFHVNPTITALSPLAGLSSATQETQSLNTEGLLDVLSVDFARALRELSIVTVDLKRLSSLGDMQLAMPEKSVIRVRFPGCDLETVERLCDELGVQRGIVHQDEDFDAITGTNVALMFPFAPSKPGSAVSGCDVFHGPQSYPVDRDDIDWRNMISPPEETITSPQFSTRSDTGLDFEELGLEQNPWMSSPGYSSMHASDEDDGAIYFEAPKVQSVTNASEFEGLEGIHRFLAECDNARRY